MTLGTARRSAAVRLRRGRRSDLDALAALEREIFKSRLFAGHLISRASFRRLLALPSATSIVAEIKAQIGAYVLVLYRASSGAARMYSIGVARKFRRRGLAGLLLTAAEKDAVRRGRKAMRLEVRADDRGTIALYESSGYRRVGRAPGYYGGRVDALRLEKALGKEPRRHL
ncbi:MAG TPA: GNAT family N-acetyltransferase [Xanthobacteraceae bacterium]|nr:GNAT family N-acetyltransferase [Xanthobacteraceae bacterium]